MRIKYFLIIVLGTLACMLVTDGLVLQPLTKQDSNLVFAKQPKEYTHFLAEVNWYTRANRFLPEK